MRTGPRPSALGGLSWVRCLYIEGWAGPVVTATTGAPRGGSAPGVLSQVPGHS